MIADWKNATGADVNERTLPDGRRLDVWRSGYGQAWIWQARGAGGVANALIAEGMAQSRPEAIAAVSAFLMIRGHTGAHDTPPTWCPLRAAPVLVALGVKDAR